jgi:pyrroline-5-carboxylate reductase
VFGGSARSSCSKPRRNSQRQLVGAVGGVCRLAELDLLSAEQVCAAGAARFRAMFEALQRHADAPLPQ